MTDDTGTGEIDVNEAVRHAPNEGKGCATAVLFCVAVWAVLLVMYFGVSSIAEGAPVGFRVRPAPHRFHYSAPKATPPKKSNLRGDDRYWLNYWAMAQAAGANANEERREVKRTEPTSRTIIGVLFVVLLLGALAIIASYIYLNPPSILIKKSKEQPDETNY